MKSVSYNNPVFYGINETVHGSEKWHLVKFKNATLDLKTFKV